MKIGKVDEICVREGNGIEEGRAGNARRRFMSGVRSDGRDVDVGLREKGPVRSLMIGCM